MMFTKQPEKIERSGVFLRGEELALVTEFKYLGVILDPTLSFRKHIKKVCNSVKYGLANFRQIRNSLTDSAALMFFHSMILSHIDYCLPIWSLACSTALRPIESLYKRGLKILDKKPHSVHTCSILKKRKFLSLQNFKTFRYACFVYKTLHGLAPSPLKEFFRRRSVSGMNTRACDRGDCEIPHRRTSFGMKVVSVVGGKIWNSLPSTLRTCPSYSSFKRNLKEWLKTSQICNH